MTKKVDRWFEAGKKLNWRKSESQTRRRKNALAARHGNLLATARALQALANVTEDNETARKSRSDAIYFFKLHAKKKNKYKK